MNKFFNLIIVLCLAVVSSTAWGESINESQARSIASRFMSSHKMQSTGLQLARKAPQPGTATSSDKAAYYVFNNASREGYVIVAGDDRAPAVLGYSDKGSFDNRNLPEAMQALLEEYSEQIAALDHGAKPAPQLRAAAAIKPLVTSNWSQNNPYNILLPVLSSGKHAYAGCVATALAQVMYYHKWPASTTNAIPAYTTSSLSIYMPQLPITTFDWDSMHDNYQTDDTTSAAALEAAKLTLYCAQSVEMNFNINGSGATSTRIPMMVSSYFGYKPTAHSIGRGNYTSQEWADALYSELAAGRPIIYSGSKKTGGHAFVCDGYDGNGMYHINWGWNGQSNGYFLLNVLNPDAQGTGSASGTYGYILTQAAIVGIEPGTDGSSTFELTSSDVTLDSYTTSRSDSNYGFTATVSGRFYNYTSQVMAVSYGWGLYQGGTLKSVLYESYYSSLRPGFYLSTNAKALSFGKNLTSGTYRIVPIYSEYSANNWRPCIGADKNYIEVTINGNTCYYSGHGTAATPDFTINNITYAGNMHNGRPVDINVNMTNNGDSNGSHLYMFADGTFVAAGYVGLVSGETGDILFRYVPATAGTHTLTWSWNDDGSNPIATRNITINAMPAANLSATITVLNATGNIINSDKFSLNVKVTNNGSTYYREDFAVKLYKNTQSTSGANVQAAYQYLELAPGQSTTLEFDLDNVSDGWKYFVWSYYYSEGTEVRLKGTSSYTIVFPEAPQAVIGDVDGDGKVSIKDVSVLIDHLLGTETESFIAANADMNGDNAITIADVSKLIDQLLAND